MIVSNLQARKSRRRSRTTGPPDSQTGGRATSLDLIKTLYAQAPHAILHAPYCTLEHVLEGCQYLASTDGERLSAAVAYTSDSIEFTWSLAGRAETLRNLIAQVQHRLKSVSFVPVMETGRKSWSEMLGVPVLGRLFRAYLPEAKAPAGELRAGFEIQPLDPQTDAEAASCLMNAAYPSLPKLTTPENIQQISQTHYFFPDGCFFLVQQGTGQRVGLAISALCEEMQEGFVDWVQVAPRFRHHGLGSVLLRESIRRLCDKANFITASGSLDAPFASGELYRECGFEHSRQWTVLGQGSDAPDRHLPFVSRIRTQLP
ncbi:GNAT family N-acetyltransferase [Candidatus Eisenbacteria bacterium]|uniref:GNAT family N-acetyltransferase n=1 Tax=Eiseniibacteriota bacterium TaxID=2212470 RepID=A0ABV6YL84_UNCEI